MSGKGNGGKPRRHPGIAGKRPDGKARRIHEAEERRLKHEKEGSPRSKKKKRLAAILAVAQEAKAKFKK